jgi:DNA-binding SARP family transcriptional activator
MEQVVRDTGVEIVVEMASGRVVRDAIPVVLSQCETTLAVAIAAQPRSVPRRTLASLLYPERNDAAAANMLKVYVYRLRRRVGSNFIVHTEHGYALGAQIAVDLYRGERALREIEDGRISAHAVGVERLLLLARGLRAEAPRHLEDAPWYEGVGQRARRVGRDLAMATARALFVRGDVQPALCIVRELIDEDRCDEDAWEFLIRAHLRDGRRVAAIRGYRSYEAALARELDTGPSPYLRRLFEDSRHAAAV